MYWKHLSKVPKLSCNPCTVQLLLLLSLLSSLLLLLYILKEYYYCYFCCHRYYYSHHLFYYSCHYHHYFGFLAHGWELFLASAHREAGKSDCVFVITKLVVFFYLHSLQAFLLSTLLFDHMYSKRDECRV